MGHSPPLLVIPRWSHYNPFIVGRITKKPTSCLPPADLGDRILDDQGLRIWRHIYQKGSSSDSQKAETISSLAKIQVPEFYIAVIPPHLGIPGSSSPHWPLSGEHQVLEDSPPAWSGTWRGMASHCSPHLHLGLMGKVHGHFVDALVYLSWFTTDQLRRYQLFLALFHDLSEVPPVDPSLVRHIFLLLLYRLRKRSVYLSLRCHQMMEIL